MRSNNIDVKRGINCVLEILLVLLMGLKLTGYVDWPLWVILAPMWVPLSVAGVSLVVLGVLKVYYWVIK